MDPHTNLVDRMVGIRQISDRLQRSRASIYRDIAKKEFPRPLEIGKSSRWLQSDVETFIASKSADRAAD